MRALLILLFVAAFVPLAAAQEAILKPGTGEDVAEAGCATCHSLAYIQMNAPFMTPDVWKAEVTKMRAAFGAPIDDGAAATILTYLIANYGVPAK
jgi:hypothetical protein